MHAFVEILFKTTGLPVGSFEKDALSADTLGFVWVDAIDDQLLLGEIAEMAKSNQVVPERRWGYWSGIRGSDGKWGQRATSGEKVLYHCHGEFLVLCHIL